MFSFLRSPHSGGYILILDDEPGVRASLTRAFEKHGYSVLAARNAEEAFKAINPNLRAAILDVVLVNSAGKSGVDVLAAIRARSNVPVLMFTGFGLRPEVLAAIEQHGADLVHKPVSYTELADWVERRTGSKSSGASST